MGILLQGHGMDKDSTDFYEGDDDAEEIFRKFFFGGGMRHWECVRLQLRLVHLGSRRGRASINQGGGSTGFNPRSRVQILSVIFMPLVNILPELGGIAIRRCNTASRDSLIRCLIVICFRSKDSNDHLQFRSPYGSPSKNDETNGYHRKAKSFVCLKIEVAGMVMRSSQEIVELPESRASVGRRHKGRYGIGLKNLSSLAKVMSLGEMV